MTGSCFAGIMTLRSRGMKVIGWSRLLDLLWILPGEGGFAKAEERLGPVVDRMAGERLAFVEMFE